MANIASVRGSAFRVLVRISTKRSASSRPSSEEFLALIESKNDRRRRRNFAGQSRHLPDVAQGVEKLDEPAFGLDEVLDVGAAARQAALRETRRQTEPR